MRGQRTELVGSATAKMTVDVNDSGLTVDCETLSPLLRVPASNIPALLRQGAITSLCEEGVGEHAGGFRLTFFYQGKRARIMVGPAGEVLGRAVIDFGDWPLPLRLRLGG